MKRHSGLWVSTSQKNVVSWQHTKYVGWLGGGGSGPGPGPEPPGPPSDPAFSIANSIYAWDGYIYYRSKFHVSNMRSVTLENNGKECVYYVIDQNIEGFDPLNKPLGLGVFPASYIFRMNGTINGKEYITVKNYSSDKIEPNAKRMDLIAVGAFTPISSYISYNANDYDTYKNYFRLEGEVINAATWCRLNDFRPTSYEYKVHEGSFFNSLFSTPDIVKTGTLKYKGYDYRDAIFGIDVPDLVASSGTPIVSNNLPAMFSEIKTSQGIQYNNRLPGPNSTAGFNEWSSKYPGGTMPEYWGFGAYSNVTPTNTFYGLTNMENNPYLPNAGADNPYEVQSINFVSRGSGWPGCWFHFVTRYWWNPTE